MKQNEKLLMQSCCDCRHFRMWMPQKMYCTFMKTTVNPLKQDEPCFTGRKGVRDCLTGEKIIWPENKEKLT